MPLATVTAIPSAKTAIILKVTFDYMLWAGEQVSGGKAGGLSSGKMPCRAFWRLPAPPHREDRVLVEHVSLLSIRLLADESRRKPFDHPLRTASAP